MWLRYSTLGHLGKQYLPRNCFQAPLFVEWDVELRMNVTRHDLCITDQRPDVCFDVGLEMWAAKLMMN